MNTFSGEKYTMVKNDDRNNFRTSFIELLKRNHLVDVTLVADGYMVNAHRLVLSALSPLFCDMFTNMPVNQQAFVFLKDVSKHNLEDLITFIYRGEVSVAQQELENFLKMAEALKIKGVANPKPPVPQLPASVRNTFQFQSSHTMRFTDSINVKTKPTNIERKRNHCMDGNANDFQEMSQRTSNDGNQFADDMNDDCSLTDQKCDAENKTETGNDTHIVDEIQPPKDAPAMKRAKINNNTFDYNIVADIRTDAANREHIIYDNEKFGKQGKPKDGRQRWQCTKHNSSKCQKAVTTMLIDGTVMMRVSSNEHSHGPSGSRGLNEIDN